MKNVREINRIQAIPEARGKRLHRCMKLSGGCFSGVEQEFPEMGGVRKKGNIKG